MNNLQNVAKQEYFIIKFLEISVLCLAIILVIFFLSTMFKSDSIQITIILYDSIPFYGFLIASIGFVGGLTYWRWYRIPPALQNALIPYFEGLGFITKQTLFHILRVYITPDIYFQIKISLHKFTSNEDCLFYMESMRLLTVFQNPGEFKRIAAQYLLCPDLVRQKFTTTCELEEVHLRSLLLTSAIKELVRIQK